MGHADGLYPGPADGRRRARQRFVARCRNRGRRLLGLVFVALFSQAAELLVLATALLVGAELLCRRPAAQLCVLWRAARRIYDIAGCLQGSSNSLGAWSIAADRMTEILIGIGCGSLASVLVLPRYAGDALREAQAATVTAVARYIATALRLSSPATVFAQLRRQMVAQVVSFDALCSFALFEAPELRVDQDYLQRTIREFLIVLSIGRGLFVRLEEFDDDGVRDVRDRLRATLDEIATKIELIAADPAKWETGPACAVISGPHGARSRLRSPVSKAWPERRRSIRSRKRFWCSNASMIFSTALP